MVIFKDFIVIEAVFTIIVIIFHQFSPVQVVAVKQLLALSLSQV